MGSGFREAILTITLRFGWIVRKIFFLQADLFVRVLLLPISAQSLFHILELL